MPMAAEDIETMIREAIPDARVEITDLAYDAERRTAVGKCKRFLFV